GAAVAAGTGEPVMVERTMRSAAEATEQLALSSSREMMAGACPDCGSQLEYAEGCVKCHVCGFSECG
ncbi:MAG TPA: hypothetical protein VJ773_01690, partial [Gemmatimonadales bacterium]|nr:hypothetical protein [Gemmatimonadales bacterium]